MHYYPKSNSKYVYDLWWCKLWQSVKAYFYRKKNNMHISVLLKMKIVVTKCNFAPRHIAKYFRCVYSNNLRDKWIFTLRQIANIFPICWCCQLKFFWEKWSLIGYMDFYMTSQWLSFEKEIRGLILGKTNSPFFTFQFSPTLLLFPSLFYFIFFISLLLSFI